MSADLSTPIQSQIAHFHATFGLCVIPIRIFGETPADPLHCGPCCGETPGMSESILQQIEVGTGADARRIAVRVRDGAAPALFWLGGFKSDMGGTKAETHDDWAAAQGRACVRFDYSGHGESGGDFVEGAIGRWLEESAAVFQAFVKGPAVLIGSSMGGWLALLLARELRGRQTPGSVAGLVLIAPAVDFTEELKWKRYPDEVKRQFVLFGSCFWFLFFFFVLLCLFFVFVFLVLVF